jgi:glutamate-ammonia-ligase adenylyltransferase
MALFMSLTQMIRLCLAGPLDRSDLPPGLGELLLRATDLPDIGVLEAHVKETSRRVRRHFTRLLRAGAANGDGGRPAASEDASGVTMQGEDE